ncbi:MAG: hypothetical protein A2W98_02495 [Bacteroidetes bacterium GWF2_33_38]|nr:MAG: hypothetical protein A2W98_02495 [Bacteroidetes bacterium GWF2_33_38]OFY92004.1 MAG: hypothetical protein A2236_11170 [Bacteroidetes bacterium RIFOXYA2_FULL_33_7]
MKHIGERIKQYLTENKISVIEFSKKINRSRAFVYSIFERESIDTSTLLSISKVLNHNFFQYFSDDYYILKEERAQYLKTTEESKKLNFELLDCKKELAELKEKYELQKKINSLLEEKVKETTYKK